jgi:hypothetical protein
VKPAGYVLGEVAVDGSQTSESHFEWPPEPGFARREAYSREENV